MNSLWQRLVNRSVVGITFTRNAVYGANIAHGWRGRRLDKISTLECPALVASAEAGSWDTLGQALQQVVAELSTGPATVRLGLPAPLVSTITIVTPDRPKNRKEAEALVTWRASSLSGTTSPVRVSANVTKVGGMYRIAGIVADESLCQAVASGIGTLPVALTSIDASTSVRWNSLGEIGQEGTGAFVDVMDDYWSLIIWDDTGWPVLVKSKWRTPTPQGDAQSVAREVLRLLSAQAEAEHGVPVSRCHLAASAREIDSFRDALSFALSTTPIVISGAGRKYPELRHSSNAHEALAKELACA